MTRSQIDPSKKGQPGSTTQVEDRSFLRAVAHAVILSRPIPEQLLDAGVAQAHLSRDLARSVAVMINRRDKTLRS